jgi:ABC-2 type transport system permease protein
MATSLTSEAAASPTKGGGPSYRSQYRPASSLWALYLLTLRQYMRGKRWLIVGLLFLLPAGMAVLVRMLDGDAPPLALEFMLVQMFIPQALLPFVALLYASGMLQDEQEEQTLTYLLIRPLSKWSLYLVKLLATLTTTTFLVAVFTAITYLAIYFRESEADPDVLRRCLTTIAIQSLAVVCYCSLFGLMSLLTRRILIVGIVYAVVVEGMLANLPFGIRLLTIIYYTRVIAYRAMSFVVSFPDGGTEDFAAEAWQFDLRVDPSLAEHPSIRMCVGVLILTSLVCAIVAAWLCSRREFHVKTPESAA